LREAQRLDQPQRRLRPGEGEVRVRETPREKLARMLRDEGFDLEARAIHSAEGYHRIYAHLDDTTVCWEAYAVREGQTVYLHSYERITTLARKGFVFDQDTTHPTFFEFWAKASK
jgi:hypothetical protein